MPSSNELWRTKHHLSKSQINGRFLHSRLGQSESSFRSADEARLPIPAEWLSQHFCQSLDEAEAKEDPLSCSYAHAKAKQSQYYRGDGEKDSSRLSEDQRWKIHEFLCSDHLKHI